MRTTKYWGFRSLKEIDMYKVTNHAGTSISVSSAKEVEKLLWRDEVKHIVFKGPDGASINIDIDIGGDPSGIFNIQFGVYKGD